MKQNLIIVTLFISIRLNGQGSPFMGSELGVLEVKIETYKENIVILNKDGSTWTKFDFDFENKLDNKDSYTFDDIKRLYNWNDDFKPYAFHIDNSLLMFICTGVNDDKYKVVVNKETGLEKYIKKENFWILRDWQDHIIHSVVSIDFEIKSNPIRSNPNDEATIIKVSANIDPVIEPIEINGDWLKIRYWQNEREMIGWIKWKICNQIILKLFYLI